ncbi:DMT family transporter [uncultured Tenacibaculum sp.]|uniref:DMT family transporter n=1 Tax=Tenacibaculum sp. A30 TaxID=3442644 RepID=UPI002630C713|nr:DMT family transporter [uncultured Tenacibaculum sp.]
MIFLIFSVFITSLLFVIFKLFDVYKVNTFQAIVLNYAVALCFGFVHSEISLSVTEIPQQPWFLGATLLGFLFITVFLVMGITAQKNGLSVASIAGKMSVVIPVVLGIFLYNESIDFVKFIGIILALVAVYLSSAKSDTAPVKFKNLLFPMLLFLGSGSIDTLLKYTEDTYVSKGAVPMFLSTIFGCALLFGIFFSLLQFVNKKVKLEWKTLVGGIALGVPNYYSMEFLLKALQTKGLESATIFTINNVSVVVLTTVFALLFFKEKLVKKNWIGIGLAIISILLVVSA